MQMASFFFSDYTVQHIYYNDNLKQKLLAV